MTSSSPPPLTLLTRALRLRCPHCGAAGILRSWFRMADECPTCGLALNRHESGYQVGAYMFNIILAEMIFATLFIATLLRTWPDPPWTLLTYGGAALMVVLPLLTFPIAKTLFLAFDLIFRPKGYDSEDDLSPPTTSS